MKNELISKLDECYDVISDDDGIILVESNRKYDFSFKVNVENICKQFSEKSGIELDPVYDINDRKIIYATIDAKLLGYGDNMEDLIENIKDIVEAYASEYTVGYDPELEQIIVEVPPIREDEYALFNLKTNLNKLDFWNGGKSLGAELDGPYNDFVLYPNLDALKIDYTKNYIICNGDFEY